MAGPLAGFGVPTAWRVIAIVVAVATLFGSPVAAGAHLLARFALLPWSAIYGMASVHFLLCVFLVTAIGRRIGPR